MKTLEKKIQKSIHKFDPISLLYLLEYLGYRREEIQFKSNASISSQPSLIQDIHFQQEPIRQVVVIVNFGLLSAQSPLPSYFLKKLDTGMIDTLSFLDFIGYFDNAVITHYLYNLYPELNSNLFPDWELTKRRYLQMLDFKSCSTLHWFFQLAFPELEVKVEKVRQQRALKTSSIRLGITNLGSNAVFGKEKDIPVYGRGITLFSEREFSHSGVPWPREIKKRLEDLIFPILREIDIDLEIVLVIRSQKRYMKLHSESYLGYDKIQGGQARYRRIRIFHGQVRGGFAIPQ